MAKKIVFALSQFKKRTRAMLNGVAAIGTYSEFIKFCFSSGMSFDDCKAELDQKLPKAELKTAEKRILDVKTRLKPSERTAIVKAAKSHTGDDSISAKSLGINIAQIHPEKSARVQGMGLIGYCEIIHDRRIHGLPVDETVIDADTLACLPVDEITAESTVGEVYALACATTFDWRGEDTSMNAEFMKVSKGLDAGEIIKMRGQLTSGVYRQKVDIKKPLGKLNANTQADIRDAVKQRKSAVEKHASATKHVSGVVNDNTSVVSLLFTHAQKLFNDVKIPRFAKTDTIQNRIAAFVNASPNVRDDCAKGKGKSEILKAIVPTLKD